MIGHAIDVSHHQPVGSVPFERIAKDRPPGKDWTTACIVRATYGVTRDRLVEQHFPAARAAGFSHVGLYHFFRSNIWPVKQALEFTRTAKLVGLGDQWSDLVPILDVEDDGGREPEPEWLEAVWKVLTEFEWDFGVRPMVYSTDRVFEMLGRPAWLLTYPWWVAHYTTRPKPLAPAGCDLRMWQHRVAEYGGPEAPGVFKATGRGLLDQNRILARLPTFGDPRRPELRGPALSGTDA